VEHIPSDIVYYYDKASDTTIINYSVKGNIIYNNILYSIKNGNYCNKVELKEYNEMIGLNNEHTLIDENSALVIYFVTNGVYDKNKNKYSANLFVGYYDKKGQAPIKLESSSGTFEIINDELIYTRTNITYIDENIEVPNISNFIIKNRKLILEDNYLDQYETSIILK